MTLSSRQIEEVVRRVLEQMQPSTMTEEHTSNAKSNRPLAELSERVVTTEQIATIMPGTAIRVPPSAVVTPAAIDMLRDRNVTLVRSTRDGQNNAEKNQLWIVNTVSSFDASRLGKELQRQGMLLNRQTTSHLTDAVRYVVDHLSRGVVRAVLLTEHTAVASCMANRSPLVRALHAKSVEEIEQACEEMAPNLLLLNPVGREMGCLEDAITCFVNSKAMQPLLKYQTILAVKPK